MFKITPAAADQVRKAASESGATDTALRLAAHKGADGVFDYRMGFDAVTEDDIRLHIADIEVVMAPEYVPLLDQTTLDFVKLESGETEFIFINPKDTNYSPA